MDGTRLKFASAESAEEPELHLQSDLQADHFGREPVLVVLEFGIETLGKDTCLCQFSQLVTDPLGGYSPVPKLEPSSDKDHTKLRKNPPIQANQT